MKVLKGTVVFLILLILLAGLVSFFLPESVRVERSIVINAPAEQVFGEINNLRKFSEWSPWSKIDPAMQQTYTGPDEGVGAKMAWASEHSQVGSGTQEIIESRPNEYVKTRLNFGWGNPAEADFTLVPEGGGTRITWGLFSLLPNPVEKYFGLMMDKWVGSAYEEGLADLKARVEGQ